MLNDQLMQLIAQIVSTGGTSVAVIDTEKGAPRPVLSLFELGFDDVQDYRYSVLVVVPDDPLMSIRCI